MISGNKTEDMILDFTGALNQDAQMVARFSEKLTLLRRARILQLDPCQDYASRPIISVYPADISKEAK
ncbi:MAG: hypothetical protein ACPGNV_12065 [Mangrovicoccus sp.]